MRRWIRLLAGGIWLLALAAALAPLAAQTRDTTVTFAHRRTTSSNFSLYRSQLTISGRLFTEAISRNRADSLAAFTFPLPAAGDSIRLITYHQWVNYSRRAYGMDVDTLIVRTPVIAPPPPPPPPPPPLPPPPAGTFPVEYSLARPLLANNPGALLAGQDWQNVATNADLVAADFSVASTGTGKRADGTTVPAGQYVNAALVPVVNGPPGAMRAEIVPDPVFVKAVRAWQTDTTDGYFQSVRAGALFRPTTKAWYRVVVKYQIGFTNSGEGGQAESWKMIFGGYGLRHVEWDNNSGLANLSGPGTETMLPGSTQRSWAWHAAAVGGEWTNEQWYEFIFYEERLGDTTLRHRKWFRQISVNNALSVQPVISKMGWLMTNTPTLPAGAQSIQLGVNRNRPFFRGRAQWWMWGPWEVIDGNIVADPYGLANDML